MKVETRSPKRSRPRTLFHLTVLIGLTLALPAPLQAAPEDLKKFPATALKDLTLDATYGALYFNIGGQNFIYQPNSSTSPVSLADLVVAIGVAESVLVEEANPRKTKDYYTGQPARVIHRILVKPDRK